MDFRKDINGVRAIAVLAVVLFHFNRGWVPSGFVGVDVFFVISGFLMTSIIFGGLEGNKFSLWGFYKARARRIVPALAVMLICVMVYGWYNMYTPEFKTLAKHAASSLLFVSNIVYWKESSYFAPGAEEKWLLHTWSLSVEWQFYIIYPLAIYIIRKAFSLKVSRILILIAGLLSLALSIYASRILVSSSYFLLPTRAWEMIAGGVVYLFPTSIFKRKPFPYIGIATILVSCFIFSEESYWPSYNALLPIIGTMIILWSCSDNIILDSSFAQKIGLYSYSIYLWHWPIYLYIYNTYGGVSILTTLIGIVASVAMGMLSFKYIESVFKSRGGVKKEFLYFASLALAVGIYISNGANTDMRSITKTTGNETVVHYDGYRFDNNGMWDKCNSSEKLDHIDKSCVDTDKRGGVFLWGDSHAGALSLGIRSLLKDGVPFYQLAASSCKPSLHKFPGVISATIGCNLSNEKAIEDINIVKPDVVVLAQRFQHEETDWQDIAEKIHALGVKKVIVLGPVPQWKGSLPLIVAKNYNPNDIYIDNRFLDKQIVATNNKMKTISKDNEGYDFVDILDGLCAREGTELKCRSRVDSGFTLMSMDYGHPTDEGSVFIGKNIIKSHLPASLTK
ncbi:acyltransferase [Escherichia coli]|uniref:acyltransferase family protein n=2 Tax=Escherichia coli TaxID=562 RepID=UPI0017F7D347|nr:acyltransferase family protein [Escherichia coli]EEV7160171.1 acyltransferase [Escherichia coli]EEZ4953414.1 acyltransferase [Escherichia coli]EFE7974928.1 acyltransferase [Escherichia coli]EFH4694012.1 acyltransferase family protein [Escherichia coli]EFL6416558.1 acyltransferase [Escherichia coli]